MKSLHLLQIFILTLFIISCDSDDSSCLTSTWYQDLNSNGLGNPNVSQEACDQPDGYVLDNTDTNDGNNVNAIGIETTINGGTYSNYIFTDAIYQITLNGNTMSIDAGDLNGDQITLFLNGTGGFDAGTVKTMGDLDSNNFTTYVNIRQLSSTQTSYFSTSGNVTITGNIAHPTESGIRLISGTVNITAASTTDNNTTTMTGSFTELEYEN